MKNIIPCTALIAGLIGTPVFAEEKEISPEKSRQQAISTLAMITGKKVNASLESNDAQQSEEWRRNTESFAKNLLPGNPVGHYANGIQVIGYNIGQSGANGTRVYAGAYRDISNGGSTNFGIMVNIPLGKK